MTEAEEKEIRTIVQNEFLGIITDAQEQLGSKDPTGMAKKALAGLAELIRRRQSQSAPGGE